MDDRAQRNTDEWWTTKVDLDGLESDFGARELSFTDFRWLLQRPLTPSSLVGLRQLLGLYEDSGGWAEKEGKGNVRSKRNLIGMASTLRAMAST